MQKITRRKVAEYVADQLHSGVSTKKLVDQAVAYLKDQGKLADWELLVRDVEDVLARKYHVVSARITTARALDADTRKALKDFIMQTEKAQSVTIVSETVDADLIGGVVVRTPSNVFDSSVQSKLKQLVATTKG